MERVAAKKAEAYIKTQPYRTIPFPTRSFQMFAGAFVVMIFMVVPMMAERAVPGDVLYPIKVSFNEEVRGTLTFSPTEKIAWETERMERRISEVRLLATAGKLTDAVEAEAAEAVKVHAAAAQEEISKLRETDADEAAIAAVAFGTALEVQTAVFDTAVMASTTQEAPDVIAAVVREAYSAIEADNASSTPSYEKITAHLERETTRAYELSITLKDSSTPEEQAEIERRLQDIDRKITAGNTRHEAEGVVGEELMHAVEAVQKLISFMTDIDVRNSVALEVLVPVELTEEEKGARIEATLLAMEAVTTLVRDYEATTTDSVAPEVMEKAVFGVTTLETMRADIITMRDERRFDDAITAAANADALVRDIQMILNNNSEGAPEEVAPEVEGEATTTEPIAEEDEVPESEAPTTTE